MDARSAAPAVSQRSGSGDGSRHAVEITLRGLLLGAVITVVFMTANRCRGVLLASGFLVGESVVGMLLAAADTLTGRSGSLAFAADTLGASGPWLGLLVFALVLIGFYRIASRADAPHAQAGS